MTPSQLNAWKQFRKIRKDNESTTLSNFPDGMSLHTDFTCFTQGHIQVKSIPSNSDWKWSQSCGRVSVEWINNLYVVMRLLTTRPRRTKDKSASIPRYKIWIYEIKSHSSSIIVGTQIWVQKGQEYPISSLSDNQILNFDDLFPDIINPQLPIFDLGLQDCLETVSYLL